MIKNKIVILILVFATICGLLGCGSPNLEDKIGEENYETMKNGKWNAKYISLDEVKIYKGTSNNDYPNNKALMVNSKNNNTYELVFFDSNNDGKITSKYGTEIKDGKLKINKAEVLEKSIGKSNAFPILLVNEEDAEIIEETIINDILENNKSYNEIGTNALIYMMDLKNGKIGYDKKYEDRVAELLKEYEEESNRLQKEINAITSNSSQTTEIKYKAKFGKFIEGNVNDKTLVVKFKIEQSMTNKMTIDQNGYNIEDIILNQGADKFDEIQYWAVSDMTDGSEGKVISFTIDKEVIEKIKNKEVVGNKIITVAKDVWILPSLKQ